MLNAKSVRVTTPAVQNTRFAGAGATTTFRISTGIPAGSTSSATRRIAGTTRLIWTNPHATSSASKKLVIITAELFAAKMVGLASTIPSARGINSGTPYCKIEEYSLLLQCTQQQKLSSLGHSSEYPKHTLPSFTQSSYTKSSFLACGSDRSSREEVIVVFLVVVVVWQVILQ